MGKTFRSRWALVPLLGCAVLGQASEVAAYSCSTPRQVLPFAGATLPSDGLLWDVCYYPSPDGTLFPGGGCDLPAVSDSAGRAIELVVERQVRSSRYTRVLTAYRPAAGWRVGERYRVLSNAEPTDREFTVVEPDSSAPEMPVVSAVDFSVHEGLYSAFNARLTFEPFVGHLVVDPDGTLADPVDGLEITWQEAPTDVAIFYLANEPCYVNFAQATWGASASPRFGTIDLAGNFSGWSEPVAIEFPMQETFYPEDVRPTEAAGVPLVTPPPASANTSGCSVSRAPLPPGSASLALVAGLFLAGVVRRRHAWGIRSSASGDR